MQPMQPKMKPDTDAEAEVTYRWLEMPELMLIDPIINQHNWTPLNEATSRVLVAEAGGKIVGFIVMQLYPHLEPLWVDKAHRSDGIAENLAAKMMEFLNEVEVRGFQVCADTEFAKRLCEAHGMELVTAPVYRMAHKASSEDGVED
jgi:ribosomal protein S18 acetylase RimI-like enzyme